MLNTQFMQWVDFLPEVGDKILHERDQLAAQQSQVFELENQAAALRADIRSRQIELIIKIAKEWSQTDIGRAKSKEVDPNVTLWALSEMLDESMRTELHKMDGFQTATEALLSFHHAGVIRQHNLLSTASLNERLDTLKRVVDWWNIAALPVFERQSK